MVTFINLIFEGLELPLILELSSIQDMLMSSLEWWQALNPQLIFSIVFYLACSWGIFSLTLRLLYRTVKKIIHYPHKKGCEFK